jgi:hypothetical protein
MVYFLIIAAALLRLIPHLPNFAPIAAIALFSAVYLNKKYALIIALCAMLISDAFLGFADFWVTISVYGSFLLIGLLGFWLKKNKNAQNLIGASLSASIIFYLLTNFAVWAGTGWYPKTISGLILCYEMAIPFFRNTIFGDLFYCGVLFGVYEVILIGQRKLKTKNEKVKTTT